MPLPRPAPQTPDDHLHNDPTNLRCEKIAPGEQARVQRQFGFGGEACQPERAPDGFAKFHRCQTKWRLCPRRAQGDLRISCFSPRSHSQPSGAMSSSGRSSRLISAHPMRPAPALSRPTPGFGNISLQTLYGKTLKSGLMAMGGFGLGSHPPPNARPAPTGRSVPNVVLGYASKKTGNVWGALGEWVGAFPRAPKMEASPYSTSTPSTSRTDGRSLLSRSSRIRENPKHGSFHSVRASRRLPLSERRISPSKWEPKSGATHRRPVVAGRSGQSASRSHRSCRSPGRSDSE